MVLSHFAQAGQTPAPNQVAASGAAVRRASATVELPNHAGGRRGSKVEAELEKGTRKITIHRRREVRVGDLLIWQSERTTNIYCDSEVREKLCDVYDQLPIPIPEE